MSPAGGWRHVLETFKNEYVAKLRGNPKAHVVMLIDLDGNDATRRVEFATAIPDDLKSRVFVVGSQVTPETLRTALSKSFEKIGESLAGDCAAGTKTHWDHEQVAHNDPDRVLLQQTVKPFLF